MPVYYIDPAGSDENDGLTEQTPWAHVPLRRFAGGDEIRFKAGCEHQGTVALRKSGGYDRLIVGTYGDGDDPLIVATPGRPALKLAGVLNAHIGNLRLTGGTTGVAAYDCDGLELTELESFDNELHGAELSRCRDPWLAGGSYWGNGKDQRGSGVLVGPETTNAQFQGVACYGNAEDGIQFSTDCGSGGVVDHCELYENLEDGLDIKAGAHEVLDSWIYANAQRGIGLHQDCGLTRTSNNRIVCNRYAVTVDDGASLESDGDLFASEIKSALHIRSRCTGTVTMRRGFLALGPGERPHIENDTAIVPTLESMRLVRGFAW